VAEAERNGPESSVAVDARARELTLLDEMGRTIQDAARILVSGMEERLPLSQAWAEIRDLEHQGDAIARDLFDALLVPRAAPADPASLQVLTGLLDDVLDGIEAAAARLALHRLRRMLPVAVEMAREILDSAGELQAAIGQFGRPQDLFPHTRALHRAENRVDDLLRQAIEVLFSGRFSAKDIIKWKDICEILEACTDRYEDLANVLETIAVRAGGGETLRAGRLVLDVERHEARVADQAVPLSGKEFALLQVLMRHQGKVVRRERLLHEVWGEDYFGDTRTLDTHIGWLRKKVEPEGGVEIVAVRGVGYRLDLRE
jgi:uncharacterized protein Yka (UPF0111/DUF47 family)